MRSRLCRLISMSVTTLLMLATAMGQERAARSVTYQPNLESIGEHQVPRWYQEAKLGIFVHWGLYSVPAWAPPSGELGKVPLAIWLRRTLTPSGT